jgi:hypothetical protein
MLPSIRILAQACRAHGFDFAGIGTIWTIRSGAD